jgi:hypothetical protein
VESQGFGDQGAKIKGSEEVFLINETLDHQAIIQIQAQIHIRSFPRKRGSRGMDAKSGSPLSRE